MKFTRILFYSLLLGVGYAALCIGEPAHAGIEDLNVVTGCGPSNTPYYTGVLNPTRDTYDVYVKLGAPGQAARVSAYVRFNDGSTTCGNIGTIDASGNEWRKIGSYTDIEGTAETILQLSSQSLTKLPNANRPSLMLVSQTDPACIPTTECLTTIHNLPAYIRPAGTALEENALRVTIARPVKLSEITKVQYFADNEMLYSTKALEDFRSESIPYSSRILTRVITFESGQIAVMQASAPEDLYSGPWGIVYGFFIKYRYILIIISSAIGAILLVKLVKMTLARARKRHQWRLAHGFIQDRQLLALTPSQKRRLTVYYKVGNVYRFTVRALLIIVPILLVLLFFITFVLQMATISGQSMQPTLKDTQKVIINKTPVTLARLNKSLFIPKRGDIIAASPNFGVIDSSLNSNETSFIVKRVIALPSERVVINRGVITIYNKANPEGFNPDLDHEWSSNVQADHSDVSIDITLAEDEVFLCGDNRPESIDSRFNGPISVNQIVGLVLRLGVQ